MPLSGTLENVPVESVPLLTILPFQASGSYGFAIVAPPIYGIPILLLNHLTKTRLWYKRIVIIL